MKQVLSILAMVVLIGAWAIAQSNPAAPSSSMPGQSASSSANQSGSSSDEQQLLGVEQQWAEAGRSGDANALARIEADGYVFTDPNGKVSGKQDDVNGLKTGQTKYQQFDLSDMQAHVFGDTGVVTGQARLKGTSNGQDISGNYAFTDTFVKRNGQWQAVATEVTRIGGSSASSPQSSQPPQSQQPPQSSPPPER